MASNESTSANQEVTVEESSAAPTVNDTEAGPEVGEEESSYRQLVTNFDNVFIFSDSCLPPPSPTAEDGQPITDSENVVICGADGAGLPPPLSPPIAVRSDEDVPVIVGGDPATWGSPPPIAVRSDEDVPMIVGGDPATWGSPPPTEEITTIDGAEDARIPHDDPSPLPPAEEPIEAPAEA